MIIITTLVSWFGGTVVRYGIITLIGSVFAIGGLAWVRHEARAPYMAQVTELKEAIKHRDQTAEADKKLADAQASQAKELQDELDKITTAGPASCKLSGDELGRLRKLSTRTVGH